MSTLSILCVTKAERHARPFLSAMGDLARQIGAEFVIAADGLEAVHALQDEEYGVVRHVHSRGYIESVLDEAVGFCGGDYVLRLDDDERCSPAMVEWLRSGEWRATDVWKFPRMNRWPDADTFIVAPPLWLDEQTRLAVKAKSGGRTHIHAGSPYGGGQQAPCALWHDKFIVKSYAERRAVVERYERLQAGAGRDFLAFSCPEDVLGTEPAVALCNDGWLPGQVAA